MKYGQKHVNQTTLQMNNITTLGPGRGGKNHATWPRDVVSGQCSDSTP